MNDTKRKIDILFKKAKHFCDNEIYVHIELVSGKWLNGEILEVKPDFIILKERKEGEQPVFFSEIEPSGISPFKNRGDEDE